MQGGPTEYIVLFYGGIGTYKNKKWQTLGAMHLQYIYDNPDGRHPCPKNYLPYPTQS